MKRFMRCGEDDSSAMVLNDGDNFTPCDYCVVIDEAEYLQRVFRWFDWQVSEARARLQQDLEAAL